MPKSRRRLAFLPASKCRLPARERIAFPVAVTLNRLATAFRVLIPFGRRIYHLLVQKSAKYRHAPNLLQAVFVRTITTLAFKPPADQSQTHLKTNWADRLRRIRTHLRTVVFSDHQITSWIESPAGTFKARLPP